MKKYKKLYVPALVKELHEVRKGHCLGSAKCIDNCDDCLYAKQNLKQFIEWYNKKK